MEEYRQDAGEDQEESSRVKKRPDDTVALNEGGAVPDDLINGDDPGKGCVLYQGDDLVTHRRNDPFNDLQEDDLKEDILFRKAKDLSGFVLPHGNGLQTAAEDLGKVAGIVNDKSYQSGKESASKAYPGRGSHKQPRTVIDDDQLKHERRSSYDPDKQSYGDLNDLNLAHGAKGDDQTQGNGKNKCQRK